MAKGVISPLQSLYNNPLVPVKKDGSLRLYLDFRLLNKVIQDDIASHRDGPATNW